MTQFTCKGVKQINNWISFKHLYHSYLSAFFISAGVPNGEFPEILIAKCRSRFYCTWFFCWGEIVREINVSHAGDPVHAGDKALTRETPVQRGRVNRYAQYIFIHIKKFNNKHWCGISPIIRDSIISSISYGVWSNDLEPIYQGGHWQIRKDTKPSYTLHQQGYRKQRKGVYNENEKRTRARNTGRKTTKPPSHFNQTCQSLDMLWWVMTH